MTGRGGGGGGADGALEWRPVAVAEVAPRPCGRRRWRPGWRHDSRPRPRPGRRRRWRPARRPQLRGRRRFEGGRRFDRGAVGPGIRDRGDRASLSEIAAGATGTASGMADGMAAVIGAVRRDHRLRLLGYPGMMTTTMTMTTAVTIGRLRTAMPFSAAVTAIARSTRQPARTSLRRRASHLPLPEINLRVCRNRKMNETCKPHSS